MKRVLLLFMIFAGAIYVPLIAQETGLEELSLEELLDVKVVSAVQSALRITEAPSVVRVITATEIRERGYQCVGEALKSIPGLYVSYDHFNYNLCVRGISSGMRSWSRVVKVMIDYQSVPFLYSGANFLGPELIPIEAVQRIEVIIGPGSTLYGSDTFLGVVNIVTKEGDDIDGVLALARVGSENTEDPSYGGEVVFGKKTEKMDMLLAFSGLSSERSGLNIPEVSPYAGAYVGQVTEDDAAMPMSFFGKANYTHQNMGTFGISGNLQYLSSDAEFADWGTLTHRNKVSLYNYFARMHWDKDYVQSVFTSVDVVYSAGGPNPDDELNYGTDIHSEHRDMGYSSIGASAQLEYSPSDKISLAIGGDYKADNYNIQTTWSVFEQNFGEYHIGDSIALGGENGDTSFTNTGLYTQAIYRPTEKLNFTQGLTYTIHNVYGNFFDFRFGAVFKIFEDGNCKLLFGSSSKMPPAEMLFTEPIYSGDAVGNADLEPELARTFDIEITPLNTEDFRASFDVFYNLVDKKIGFVYSDGIYEARNCADIGIMGVEGALRWGHKSFTVNWNVSYQHTEKRSDDAEEDNDVALFDVVSFEAPRLLSYSSVNYVIAPIRLSMNFEQKYVGERNASQPNIALNGGELYKLGAYQIYNLTLSTTRLRLFPIGETRFSLSLKNLTNEEYIEPGYNGVDIPGIRRTVYFGAMQMF